MKEEYCKCNRCGGQSSDGTTDSHCSICELEIDWGERGYGCGVKGHGGFCTCHGTGPCPHCEKCGSISGFSNGPYTFTNSTSFPPYVSPDILKQKELDILTRIAGILEKIERKLK